VASSSVISGIFDKLNRLNLSLQGQNATTFHLLDKVSALMKKIMLWKSLCGRDTLEMSANMRE
jgi:hypothetical protein